jgi:hypothetical protein
MKRNVKDNFENNSDCILLETKRAKLKILTTTRQASGYNFKFNSREWRNIVTHMGN